MQVSFNIVPSVTNPLKPLFGKYILRMAFGNRNKLSNLLGSKLCVLKSDVYKITKRV